MSSAKVVVAILALSLIQGSTEAKQVLNFLKRISHVGHDFVINRKIGENVTLSYGTCQRSGHHDDSTNRTCELTLETLNSSGTVWTKTCAVPLSPADTINDGNKYNLYQVGDDSVVFVWKQSEVKEGWHRRPRSLSQYVEFHEEQLKVSVVRMSDCDIREVGVNVEGRDEYSHGYVDFDSTGHDISSVSLLSHDNGSFVLFFRNKEVCGEDKRCSLAYDSKLQTFNVKHGISLPVNYETSMEMFPVRSNQDSKVKAYLVSSFFLKDGAMTLMSPEGEVLYDHPYSHSITETETRITFLAVSVAHGNFGLCQLRMFKSTLECFVFDYAGNAKIGVTIPFELVNVAAVKMRNAADDGFWLLLIHRENGTTSEFETTILRINSDGKVGEIRKEKNRVCSDRKATFDLDLFEKKDYDICYYFTCAWSKSNNKQNDEYNLQLRSECFVDGNNSK